MKAMPLRDRVRRWLRAFLGIADLPSKEMLNALELREKQRHEAIMGMLNRIEQRMLNAHVDEPKVFSAPVLDWDTVQAVALAELEKNPQKEN